MRIIQFLISLNEGFAVSYELFWKRTILLAGTVVVLGACSMGPQITRTQDLLESADTPYRKILVVVLLPSFDSRRYFEDEVVKQLSERGTAAVASTSMMNTKTPVTRQTFLAMVEKTGADAVVVTQLVSLDSKGTMKDMNPRSTLNIRPTYYYNVWSVELTEYVEPQAAEFEHSLVLATQLYSAKSQEAVWAIESRSKIVQDFDEVKGFTVIVNEATAIAAHLSSDGLLAE